VDSKDFKNMFDEVARFNGFEKEFSGWFKASSECIAVLDLQKSNFGNYYELNIKIFIQGIFGGNYSKSKDLVKKDPGHYFTRQPVNFRDVLDLDNSLSEVQRKERLIHLFDDYIVPFTNKTLTKAGIKKLEEQTEIRLLPAVKEALGIKKP
jgi:Domain of unknown function (DUF4304)